MPTSVSGYSLCATQGDPIDEQQHRFSNDSTSSINNNNNNDTSGSGNNYAQDQLTSFTNSARQHQLNQSVIYHKNVDGPPLSGNMASGSSSREKAAGLAMSASNYSMSSGMVFPIIHISYLPKSNNP